jgi:hypothetical protein
MTNDTRALCAELLVLAEESISYRAQVDEAVNLIDRARALADYARAVLARWGHPTPQPANALPTPEAQ